MTTTIRQIQEEIVEEFALFDNPNDTYTYIIEIGKQLSKLNPDAYLEQNLVKGCQSKVWLTSEMEEGRVLYAADSDSTLVKGLIALLIRVLSNQKPEEIAAADLFFIEKIGLGQMLTMNRANGLAAMIKQMKLYALAYQNQIM
ncbi:SufE family protein [Hugenholtzia roseola]|uniref:SufE family protein n=1 Tax=Hugenholtzia roseola TaxID=1002 RepID=UPI000402B071|nr:SufE family protein [Hugenholtzia roseola]